MGSTSRCHRLPPFFAALPLFAFCSFLLSAHAVRAGQYDLKSGILLQEEYETNMERRATDQRSGWITTLAPTLILDSRFSQHRLGLRYQPLLQANHESGDHDVNHLLSIALTSTFSPHLRTEVVERFTLADQALTTTEQAAIAAAAEQTAGTVRPLSSDRGRRRYQQNILSSKMQYEYSPISHLTLEYMNVILADQTDDRNNFFRQSPSLSIYHGFLKRWWLVGSYMFTQGMFKTSADLRQHTATLQLLNQLSGRTALTGLYGFSRNTFAQGRSDYTLHTFSAGMSRSLTARTQINITAGLALIQGEKSTTSSKYSVSLTRQLDHGQLALGSDGGFDELYFNGLDQDTGLSKYWQVSGQAGFNLTEHLKTSLLATFRQDDFQEMIPARRKEAVSAGFGFTYLLNRVLTLSTDYSFSQVNYNLGNDGYDDHRFLCRLNFVHDLWSW